MQAKLPSSPKPSPPSAGGEGEKSGSLNTYRRASRAFTFLCSTIFHLEANAAGSFIRRVAFSSIERLEFCAGED
jgi:hypothetical protein